MSGNTWKKVGKIALKAAPIVAAPFTGGLSLLALGAGTGALSGALDGGGWKGALVGGGLGAIPGFGSGAGAAAGGVAKTGLKELAKGVAKGAVTNFATGTGTGLATGQGLKNSLVGGGQGALSGLGTSGAGGFTQAAKTIGKNVGMNVAGSYASKGLQKAGVPGGVAAQGANVFSNYLGNGFNTRGQSLVQQPGQFGTGSPQGSGGGWKDMLLQTGSGILDKYTKPQGGSPTYPNGAPGGGGTGGTQNGTGGGTNQQTQGGGGGWGSTYGPLIAQGAGLVIGGLAGKKATEMAQKRSPEELAALRGAQGAAGQLGRFGGQTFQQGQDYTAGPAQYYQSLLGGNRAAANQAIAGPAAQLTGVYRGAERNLDQQGIRGAARDVAAGDLNRDRASKIAGLVTGVQPYAAEQLSALGTGMMTGGAGMLGNSGNIYGSLLGQGAANRAYARNEGEETAKAIGGLSRDVGEVVFKKGKGGTATPPPGTATPKKATGIQPTQPTSTMGSNPVQSGLRQPQVIRGDYDNSARSRPSWASWAA